MVLFRLVPFLALGPCLLGASTSFLEHTVYFFTLDIRLLRCAGANHGVVQQFPQVQVLAFVGTFLSLLCWFLLGLTSDEAH